MKHIPLIFVIIFFFCSCNKTTEKQNTNINTDSTDNNDPTGSDSSQNDDPVITALKAHAWFSDSIVRVQNGIVTSSLIEGEPKLEMWFTNDKLYFNTPGGPQNDEFNYEVKGHKQIIQVA